MYDKHSPTGVLDSGIGGFSVARQLQRLLPGEDLLYFGDGAHIPYGNHPKDRIIKLARYMFDFMEQNRVKALLVACNTISCVIEACEDAVSCPTINAVQAGADAAAELDVEKVGVISTVFTHNSRVYPHKINEISPGKMVVLSCGCPDLARLVEHNLTNPEGMRDVEANLKPELDGMVRQEKIQACVLGCTHYPLVEDSIRKLYPGLPLIDPAVRMAQDTLAYLEREDMRNPKVGEGRLTIYTTGDVEEYAQRARQVGLERIDAVRSYPALELKD